MPINANFSTLQIIIKGQFGGKSVRKLLGYKAMEMG